MQTEAKLEPGGLAGATWRKETLWSLISQPRARNSYALSLDVLRSFHRAQWNGGSCVRLCRSLVLENLEGPGSLDALQNTRSKAVRTSKKGSRGMLTRTSVTFGKKRGSTSLVRVSLGGISFWRNGPPHPPREEERRHENRHVRSVHHLKTSWEAEAPTAESKYAIGRG